MAEWENCAKIIKKGGDTQWQTEVAGTAAVGPRTSKVMATLGHRCAVLFPAPNASACPFRCDHSERKEHE